MPWIGSVECSLGIIKGQAPGQNHCTAWIFTWNQLEESYQTDPLEPEDPFILVMEGVGSQWFHWLHSMVDAGTAYLRCQLIRAFLDWMLYFSQEGSPQE